MQWLSWPGGDNDGGACGGVSGGGLSPAVPDITNGEGRRSVRGTWLRGGDEPLANGDFDPLLADCVGAVQRP